MEVDTPKDAPRSVPRLARAMRRGSKEAAAVILKSISDRPPNGRATCDGKSEITAGTPETP